MSSGYCWRWQCRWNCRRTKRSYDDAAGERASERANRASCSWTGTPLYSPLHPLPPIPDPVTTDAASSLLPASSPRRGPRTLSVILELRYSDIACRRLLPPFVASSPANYSPSSINALNGNISRPRSTRALAGSFFQYLRLKRDRDGRCVFFKGVFWSRALRNTRENFRIFL